MSEASAPPPGSPGDAWGGRSAAAGCSGAATDSTDTRALTAALQTLLMKHKKGSVGKKGPWRCATPVGLYGADGKITAVKLQMACSTDDKPVHLSASNYTGSIPQHARRCTVCGPVRKG